MKKKPDVDLDDLELEDVKEPIEEAVDAAGSHMAGFVTTAVVAAAVGAGVALLFAPEKGTKTRKRLRKQLRSLELGKRINTAELGRRWDGVRDEAGSRWSELEDLALREVRRRTRSPRRDLAMGTLGTLMGAGIALLLAPETGARARGMISEGWDHLRDEARDLRQRARAARERTRTNGSADESSRARSASDN